MGTGLIARAATAPKGFRRSLSGAPSACPRAKLRRQSCHRFARNSWWTRTWS